jgi:hypothetical protein
MTPAEHPQPTLQDVLEAAEDVTRIRVVLVPRSGVPSAARRFGITRIEPAPGAVEPAPAPAVRDVLTKFGAYGWGLLFQDEPDGSRHWWVTDETGETILQSGQMSPDDDWADALLQAVMNLQPPSEEGRGERRK